MIKSILIFLAGCVATLFVFLIVAYRSIEGFGETTEPIEVSVKINLVDDPVKIGTASDIPALLNRISGISNEDKKRILDGVKSGFVTELRLVGRSSENSSTVIIPTKGGCVYSITSSGSFVIQPE